MWACVYTHTHTSQDDTLSSVLQPAFSVHNIWGENLTSINLDVTILHAEVIDFHCLTNYLQKTFKQFPNPGFRQCSNEHFRLCFAQLSG